MEFLEWADDNNSKFEETSTDFPDIDGFEPIDDDNIPF